MIRRWIRTWLLKETNEELSLLRERIGDVRRTSFDDRQYLYESIDKEHRRINFLLEKTGQLEATTDILTAKEKY